MVIPLLILEYNRGYNSMRFSYLMQHSSSHQNNPIFKNINNTIKVSDKIYYKSAKINFTFEETLLKFCTAVNLDSIEYKIDYYLFKIRIMHVFYNIVYLIVLNGIII